MKLVTLFFDTEGALESPYRQEYDENIIVNKILKILNKYNMKAVFNVSGKIAQKYPLMIRNLHEQGHEIAAHGYAHENFLQLDDENLINVLNKTNNLIKKIIKQKPLGIRLPGLLYNKRIYSIIKQSSFRWVSNQYTLFPEMFLRPDYKDNWSAKLAYFTYKIKNINYNKKPHKVNGLLEIPLTSSLETDLLSIVSMQQNSPAAYVDFAFKVLKTQYNNSGKYFNLNFHPWMIGSANRLLLLDRILRYLSSKKAKYVLARELL